MKNFLVKREIIGDRVHDVLTATMTERLKKYDYALLKTLSVSNGEMVAVMSASRVQEL